MLGVFNWLCSLLSLWANVALIPLLFLLRWCNFTIVISRCIVVLCCLYCFLCRVPVLKVHIFFNLFLVPLFLLLSYAAFFVSVVIVIFCYFLCMFGASKSVFWFRALLGNPKSGYRNPNPDFPIECTLYLCVFCHYYLVSIHWLCVLCHCYLLLLFILCSMPCVNYLAFNCFCVLCHCYLKLVLIFTLFSMPCVNSYFLM